MKKIVVYSAIALLLIVGYNSLASNSTATQSQSQYQTTSASSQPAATPNYSTQNAPANVFSKSLSYGSSGTDVANVQQFLADEGLYYGKDTGIFDYSTENAIVAFEQQQGIQPANGIFGPTEEASANSILANHPDWVTTLSNSNEYQNVNGSTVQSPAYSSNGVPAGASAVCADGTYSFSMHRSGTCSHHGGVAEWL